MYVQESERPSSPSGPRAVAICWVTGVLRSSPGEGGRDTGASVRSLMRDHKAVLSLRAKGMLSFMYNAIEP